jgi:hypothetical protein
MAGTRMIKNEQRGWYEVIISLNRPTPWMWISTCGSRSDFIISLSSQKGETDRDRLAYIEEELSKRKGNTIREGEEVEKAFDPQEELFRIVEKYKLDAKVQKETEEGSVTNSLGMLTSIPEVDLGME